MNTNITDSQAKDYQENGFLIVRNFLSEAEREEMITAVSDTVKKMGKRRIAGNNAAETEDEDNYYDSVFLQRLNLWKINPVIKKFFTDAGLGAAVSKLAGTDKMRVWHDQTLQKMAWGNPTAWHLDNPYWSFHSRQAISIWIALDDATIQNGCLYYLPGSHKISTFENSSIDQNIAGLFKIYPEFKTIEAVPAEMKAGDAGFHNGLTAHGAGPNMTPYSRRAMTCGYMPDGSTFNGQKNILSKDYHAKLTVGDLLQDNEQNPLVG
jgi:ectoine hydroxylase-related dioxygenase (phytanoyl-CoA dioxygenase family)